MRYSLCIVMAMVPLGCNLPGLIPESPDELVVVNAADQAVAVVVFERRQSYLIDPIPAFSETAFATRKIEPGDAQRLTTIEGYSPGDDLVVLVYARAPERAMGRCPAGKNCETMAGAPLVASFMVTARDLERHRFRIFIRY